MRLWSYQLLPYLPRLQLVSQWRECCCIAKSITEKGTPNHILVNKIMDYPVDNFVEYTEMVIKEFGNRKFQISSKSLNKFRDNIEKCKYRFNNNRICTMFIDWHNDIYLRECLYNLEEKFRAGGIPADEWQVIYDRFKDFTPLWEIK